MAKLTLTSEEYLSKAFDSSVERPGDITRWDKANYFMLCALYQQQEEQMEAFHDRVSLRNSARASGATTPSRAPASRRRIVNDPPIRNGEPLAEPHRHSYWIDGGNDMETALCYCSIGQDHSDTNPWDNDPTPEQEADEIMTPSAAKEARRQADARQQADLQALREKLSTGMPPEGHKRSIHQADGANHPHNRWCNEHHQWEE